MFRKILPSHATIMLAVCATVGVACGLDRGAPGNAGGGEKVASTAAAIIVTNGATTTSTPIGLAVHIEEGVGQPLQVRAGQTFYINQIDMRASLDATVDEGVSGLKTVGDFATLDWHGLQLEDESAEDSANEDGTFTNRRFYRDAQWMDAQSTFTFVQVDAHGKPTAPGHTVVSAGANDTDKSTDAFFVRRMRALQFTNDCISRTDCTGAQSFQEEALVEVRDSLHPEATFQIRPATTALQVVWSQNPATTYTIPLQQVASPAFDYGFSIDIEPLTAPGPNGVYPVGSDITFQIQLRDGAGNPLHPAGTLPSFNAVLTGADTSGIQYWQGIFQPFITYYRRKHEEHHLMNTIMGPAQDITPVRSVLDLTTDIGPDGDVNVANQQRDGFFSEAYELPTFGVMFGGLQFPPLWDAPVPASFTYHIPPGAVPGTYLIQQKGRRVYLGQDIPASKVIEIQVGSKQHTDVHLTVGGCEQCHNSDSALSVVNHANDNLGSCSACHAPLTFELDGPIYVRTHFLHSRSDRFPAPTFDCSNCHLDNASIQRTSKSACLSCHKSYPADHVQKYGAIENMYVGSETDGFAQCSTTCHTEHPGSGLGGNCAFNPIH
jgi:hypothetical protein